LSTITSFGTQNQVRKLSVFILCPQVFFDLAYRFQNLCFTFEGYQKHELCSGHDEEFWPAAKEIYIAQRSILFKVIDFNYIYVPIFEWIHLARRAAWSYSEVLIIVFAMDLSLMFQIFNKRLIRIRNQAMWTSYWKEMRQHYLQLCALVEHANKFASPLLAIIVFSDFFFLCERLFRLIS
jgi:hypothetical protein